ncbi:MAG: PEP-CTERM sorting domain-containing protein, partial [Proteobacteria bacterium]|nr:PEP-CTERM sorting domain-containing protein [Pseudomonadota bacterium]
GIIPEPASLLLFGVGLLGLGVFARGGAGSRHNPSSLATRGRPRPRPARGPFSPLRHHAPDAIMWRARRNPRSTFVWAPRAALNTNRR